MANGFIPLAPTLQRVRANSAFETVSVPVIGNEEESNKEALPGNKPMFAFASQTASSLKKFEMNKRNKSGAMPELSGKHHHVLDFRS